MRDVAQEIDSIVRLQSAKRKSFERRWYNNNFFDDGFHYRYVSRTTGRIVDLSTTRDSFIPYRAIPKASRQIRGVANLLLANDYRPVVYPEKILPSEFQDPNIYERIKKAAKDEAKRKGQWIEKKWKDKQIFDLLTQMTILTAKHSISYIKIWPDADDEDARFCVHDAFDVYLQGEETEVDNSPYVIIPSPRALKAIIMDERFDEEARAQVIADNKYSPSEIKQAYMMSRFGNQYVSEFDETALQYEAYFNEYITRETEAKVRKDLKDDYGDRKIGSKVIRQVFSVGGRTMKDTYLSMKRYPIQDLRFEPGPLYQVPLIERFIPANKTLDAVMSRIERHIGTMAVGMYAKRRGENYSISNLSGGQIVEYDQTPPVQLQTSQLGGYVFNFIRQINDIIEEQGATTAALGQVPAGVKSGVAIESVKATDYANLKIASNQIKKTIKGITERMLEIADRYMISPQSIETMENGEPNYFDVIGQKGYETYKTLAKKKAVEMPQATILNKDTHIEIEIESGMGYTPEGKKNTMKEIIDYMLQLAQIGMVNPASVQVAIRRFLEIFEFGNTQEFMDALEQGPLPMTQDQTMNMKVAMAEVIKDAGIRPNNPMETKIAVAEVLKDVAKGQPGQ